MMLTYFGQHILQYTLNSYPCRFFFYNRNSHGSSINNNPFIVESDNGANCEVLSPVMEDECVSTVASTAPDRTLLLSGNHHRAPAPKYRSPPPYKHVHSSASKSSINKLERGGDQDDDDYADYDDDYYQKRRSPPIPNTQRIVDSQDISDQIYFAHEYTPKRQLESNNATLRSTTTINSIRQNDSINRVHSHDHHARHCGMFCKLTFKLYLSNLRDGINIWMIIIYLN